MECNKEEALRAKEIAEKRMQNKDFFGGRKIALKAQQLFPGLENISHLLTVCDVHCSAGIKVNEETDWYGILQVDPLADELLIRKQYRKLALMLHPDKNKFSGAEAAFKLIGEAHMVLSDKGKRSLHDLKRSAKFNVPSKLPSRQPNMSTVQKKQPGSVNKKSNGLKRKQQQQKQQQKESSAPNCDPTFWTICPNCAMRYQYYIDILNKTICCHNCSVPFIAYDLSSQAAPPGGKTGSSGIPMQAMPACTAASVSQKDQSKNVASNFRSQGNGSGGYTGADCSSRTNQSCDGPEVENGTEVKFEKVELNKGNNTEHTFKASAGNDSQHGRKVLAESSDSESSDDEDVISGGSSTGQHNGNPLRRSARPKQNVTYNEIANDEDDLASPPPWKKSKKGGGSRSNDQNSNDFFVRDDNEVEMSSGSGVGVVDRKTNTGPDAVEEKDKLLPGASQQNSVNGLGSDSAASLNTYTCADSEFFDFDTLRTENKFAVDQIWSVYDELDGMPRYYARIRSIIITPGFKLHFTWLEHLPIHDAEMVWSAKDLPVACGKFKLGKSEFAADCLMFCEPVTWEKGSKRNVYVLYPRKGEVWAIFKGWSTGWTSNPTKRRDYCFDLVEVLSDFEEGGYINVAYLVMIKGFECLFTRDVDSGESLLKIPSSEILRFSHKVPYYRMTGNEREGVPAGFLELDPASLPTDFKDAFPSISLHRSAARVEERSADAATIVGSNSKDTEGDIARFQHHVSEALKPKKAELEARDGCNACLDDFDWDCAGPNSTSISLPPIVGSYDYDVSEFCSFSKDKSKLQRDQIWALYSEFDGYPKYYVVVSKVDLSSDEVCVSWLECLPHTTEEKLWVDAGLPIACGSFEISTETATFEMDAFSHEVHAQSKRTGRIDRYEILPGVGEVWMLYKGWAASWTESNLKSCEYDVVEVLGNTSSGVRVQMLSKVDGYRTVFVAGKGGGCAPSVMELPAREYIRFSHRVPAFRLTEERGGKLKGCWELDPAAVTKVS